MVRAPSSPKANTLFPNVFFAIVVLIVVVSESPYSPSHAATTNLVPDSVWLYQFTTEIVTGNDRFITWNSNENNIYAWEYITVATGYKPYPVVTSFICKNLENLALWRLWPAVGQLKYLKTLELSNISVMNQIPPEIAGSVSLETLDISINKLNGTIPPITTLKSLRTMLLNDNWLVGDFPGSACDPPSLITLDMSRNLLRGVITTDISKCKNLQVLRLAHNFLHGTLPASLGKLVHLKVLDLSYNQLEGSLPISIGQLKYLKELILDGNSFSGSITPSITNHTNMLLLSLSNNKFNKTIPSAIGKLTALVTVDLSQNELVGHIPDVFSNLTKLNYFNASYNKLNGSLPATLGSLTGIAVFDVSYNDLSGLLPDLPLFRRLYQAGYLANTPNLCGPIVKTTCLKIITQTPSTPAFPRAKLYTFLRSKVEKPVYIAFFVAAILGLIILILMCSCIILKFISVRDFQESVEWFDHKISPFSKFFGMEPRLSFWDLQVATDFFSDSNIIGYGSRYMVLLGNLSKQKETVIIKVLKDEFLRDTQPQFLEDCRALKTLKDDNIMELVDWCYKPDFVALVYKNMARGSLYDNLYGKVDNFSLNWDQRLGIAVDVAHGLAFLHNLRNQKCIFFCQLCPSNILLDENFRAKISGLRVVRDSTVDMIVRDIYNIPVDQRDYVYYLSPECTPQLLLNEQTEVYSYGLTVFEMISNKSEISGDLPVDRLLPAKFKELFPYNLEPYVDPYVLDTALNYSEVLALIEIAIACTADDPRERPDIRAVSLALENLKNGKLDTIHFILNDRYEASNVPIPNEEQVYETPESPLLQHTDNSMLYQDDGPTNPVPL